MAEKIPLQAQIMSVGLARELILKCDLPDLPMEKREAFARNIDAALVTLDFLDRQADEIRESLTFTRALAKSAEARAAQEASGD